MEGNTSHLSDGGRVRTVYHCHHCLLSLSHNAHLEPCLNFEVVQKNIGNILNVICSRLEVDIQLWNPHSTTVVKNQPGMENVFFNLDFLSSVFFWVSQTSDASQACMRLCRLERCSTLASDLSFVNTFFSQSRNENIHRGCHSLPSFCQAKLNLHGKSVLCWRSLSCWELLYLCSK